jgi:hypothetical protein
MDNYTNNLLKKYKDDIKILNISNKNKFSENKHILLN